MNRLLIGFVRTLAVSGLGLLLLAACGGGGGGGGGGAGFTIGGTLEGLAQSATVTIENPGATPIIMSADGGFTFDRRYGSGSAYHVRVTDHSGWGMQGCTVTNGSGTVGSSNITNVRVECFDEVLLSASTGDEEITLRWTEPFEPEQTGMVVCWQEDDGISAVDPDHLFDQHDGCIGDDLGMAGPTLDNGRYKLVHDGLTNGITYFYQVRMQDGERVVYSNVAFTSPRVPWVHPGGIPFNDTGITRWSDGSTLLNDPLPSFHPGQDADHGRDADDDLAKFDGDAFGDAAFDYTRIGANSLDWGFVSGAAPGVHSKDWTCIRDNVTGLLWEVRPQVSGHLRHRSHAYTWYNSNDDVNGGGKGVPGQSGTCDHTLMACNTEAYVDRVNALGLCGYTDWRLPTMSELNTIVHFGRSEAPAVDPDAFPDATWLQINWSATPSGEDVSDAWVIRIDDGSDARARKNSLRYVRLVRGGAPPQVGSIPPGQSCQQNMLPTSHESDFIMDGAPIGYACHPQTGLLWRRCPLGWDLVGTECIEQSVLKRNWQDTLTYIAGLSDEGGGWRLPNIKELGAVIERRCSQPAIDSRVFPFVPAGPLWSASPDVRDPSKIWAAVINQAEHSGEAGAGDVDNEIHAFIVRDGADICP